MTLQISNLSLPVDSITKTLLINDNYIAEQLWVCGAQTTAEQLEPLLDVPITSLLIFNNKNE